MPKILKSVLQITIVIVLLFALITILYATKYDGIWEFRGYGICMRSNLGIVRTFQVSENVMMKNRYYNGFIFFNHLYCGLGKFNLEREDNLLVLNNSPAQTRYYADKIYKYEFNWRHLISDNPVYMFQAFQETFSENYAFFGLYDVDIDKQGREIVKNIDENTTKDELYKYMCEMIEGLDDAHVFIDFDDESYSFYSEPEWWSNKEQLKAITDLIRNEYIKDYTLLQDCPVRYGTINNNTGYIMLRAMGTDEMDQVSTTEEYFSEIIDNFIDMEAIIIDMRFNTGGFDSASLMTAGYFTDKPYLAYSKQVYYNENLSDKQNIYVEPKDNPYKGKVIVLTSQLTVSAGEIFILSLIANPDIDLTIIGEETCGNYSDCIEKIATPDGDIWYGLSNELYYSLSGDMVEGKGIIPDIIIPMDAEKAKEGVDSHIDAAIEIAE